MPFRILFNNVYDNTAIELHFMDFINGIEFAKTYNIVCRDTILNQLKPPEGDCNIQSELARHMSEDIIKFVENRSF